MKPDDVPAFLRARRLLPLAAAAAVSGCSLFFEEPTVSVADVRLGSVGFTGASVKIDLEVDNPNGYELEVEGLTYSLTVQSPARGARGAEAAADSTWWELVGGELPDTARIAPNTTTRVEVEVPFEYEALGTALEGLVRSGRLPYRLGGAVRLRGPVGSARIRFDEDGVLDPLAELFGRDSRLRDGAERRREGGGAPASRSPDEPEPQRGSRFPPS